MTENATLLTASHRTPEPFGFWVADGLWVFRQVLLPPATNKQVKVEQPTLLIPFIGDVEANQQHIEEFDFQVFQPSSLALRNPYEAEAIQFYLLSYPGLALKGKISINTFEHPNRFHLLTPAVAIGQFSYRFEQDIAFQTSSLLLASLHGVFEINERLLEPSDVLLLNGASRLAIEALQPGSCLLVMALDGELGFSA